MDRIVYRPFKFVKLDKKCKCGKSNWTINGRCNCCGVERKAKESLKEEKWI